MRLRARPLVCRALHVLPDSPDSSAPSIQPIHDECARLRSAGVPRAARSPASWRTSGPDGRRRTRPAPMGRAPSGRRSLSRSSWSDSERHLRHSAYSSVQRVASFHGRHCRAHRTAHGCAQDAGGGGEIVGAVPDLPPADRYAPSLSVPRRPRSGSWTAAGIASRGNTGVRRSRSSWRPRAAVERRSAGASKTGWRESRVRP